jgi:hypothetical protein
MSGTWQGLDGPLAKVDRDTAITLEVYAGMADYVDHARGAQAAEDAIAFMAQAEQNPDINTVTITTPDYSGTEYATFTKEHLGRAATLARWQAKEDREWFIADLEELPA